MEGKKHSSRDYCEAARNAQSVPSYEQYGLQHPEVDPRDYNANRTKTLYSCADSYQIGTIQDNQIYVATTDGQHDQIFRGEHVDAQGGLSGYFSDQATVDACKQGDILDNTKYNEMCQIAPYRKGGLESEGDAMYKPHVDCFDINRDTLFANYGTYDFNAAIAKCEANNHFGVGGGNQGYNPYLGEMIDNGTLVHNRSKSYSDTTISGSANCNPHTLSNSIIPEEKADKMYADAQIRAQDCVINDTPHPSPQARDNGFPPNPNPIESPTGHATPESQGLGSCGSTDAETCDAAYPKVNFTGQNDASVADAISAATSKGPNL